MSRATDWVVRGAAGPSPLVRLCLARPALGRRRRLWRPEQFPRSDTQNMGQALDVGERDVPPAALDGRHVGAVQFALVGQALLGPLFLHTQEPHPVREDFAQVGRIGQPCGWSGFGRHRARMRFCFICIYGVCFSIASGPVGAFCFNHGTRGVPF